LRFALFVGLFLNERVGLELTLGNAATTAKKRVTKRKGTNERASPRVITMIVRSESKEVLLRKRQQNRMMRRMQLYKFERNKRLNSSNGVKAKKNRKTRSSSGKRNNKKKKKKVRAESETQNKEGRSNITAHNS
jgi:hypothetical protein